MNEESYKSNILAVDSATEACSVALSSRGTVYQRFMVAPRQHHSLIFEMCKAVLDEAKISVSDIKAVVYGRGPGSFTGVRIAASLVQGLAYAHDLPVVAISDLQAVALQALESSDETQVLVAMDARMKEIYYGYFEKDNGLVKAIGDEGITTPENLIVAKNFNGIGAGSAWHLYEAHLKKALGRRLKKWYAETLPEATAMLRLAMPRLAAGDTMTAREVCPVYLRYPVRLE